MNLSSKIYVAGHTGLVGSAITRKLYEYGYKNLILKTHKELDLVDQNQVGNFFRVERPDYVFLAAARVGGIYANNKYRGDFIYQNLQIQNNIIHASYLTQVKKLLFLGSSCIYPKNSSQPLREDYLLTSELEYTNEPYAIAKIAGIKMCESYNLQYGTNFIAVMPTNLYGINDNFDLENSHVIPAMIRKIYLAKLFDAGDFDKLSSNLGLIGVKAIEERLISVGIARVGGKVVLKLWGSGNPRREFLYSDDMADACIYVMNKVDFCDLSKGMGEVRNTHINIGSGEDISLRELAKIIAKVLNYDGEIEFDLVRPDGTMRKLQDVSKINKLGWKYKIGLPEGLSRVINYYTQASIGGVGCKNE